MKTVITNNGLNIMNQTRADGSVQYWIGYFGLAYVPDENRISEGNEQVSDALDPGMSELTTSGDIIYNLFQGAMTPVGLDTDIGESAATKLFNECMYTGSVINKFRYVLDPETNTNKLIVLESVNEDGQPVDGDDMPYGLQQYTEYLGIGSIDDENNTVTESELLYTIPAPLYYRGEPVAWDDEADSTDHVSSDTRIINKSANWTSDPGTRDKYSWNSSKDYTYGLEEGDYHDLKKSSKLQSISNFNRFHAGANVTGYAVDYEPACRNMSFATKLFPISHYDVISTADDTHVANVKYTVEVDLDSVFSKISRQSTAYFEDGTKLDPVTDKDKLAKYKFGFKFNRIGLYAVPVTLHAYNANTAGNQSCGKYSIQMQLAGNSKPKLFAVRDLSAPIVLSEDGMHKCVFNFQLNVSNTNIVDESGIYYNLYESDAITWYKNQLIANASTAEAVTTLSVELNYLRKQMADMSHEHYECGVGDDRTSKFVETSTATSVIQPNLVDLGYIYHDDSYTDTETHVNVPDTDIEHNPMSDEFIERIDELLAAGCVPFVMYRCRRYESGQQPTSTSHGTEDPLDTPEITLGASCEHCESGISHTQTMIRFAPLVKIGYCSYYFANPMDPGYVIELHENDRIKLITNDDKSDGWHPYKT